MSMTRRIIGLTCAGVAAVPLSGLLWPLSMLVGLRQARRDSPEMFDGALAAESIRVSILAG